MSVVIESSVRGSFAELQQWINGIESIPEAPVLIAKRAAPLFSGMHKASWDAGQSPYGSAWIGVNGPVGLYRTGEMRRQCTAWRASGASVKTGKPPRYAQYQAKRFAFVPSSGMPLAWGEAIQAAADAVIRELMGAT